MLYKALPTHRMWSAVFVHVPFVSLLHMKSHYAQKAQYQAMSKHSKCSIVLSCVFMYSVILEAMPMFL